MKEWASRINHRIPLIHNHTPSLQAGPSGGNGNGVAIASLGVVRWGHPAAGHRAGLRGVDGPDIPPAKIPGEGAKVGARERARGRVQEHVGAHVSEVRRLCVGRLCLIRLGGSGSHRHRHTSKPVGPKADSLPLAIANNVPIVPSTPCPRTIAPEQVPAGPVARRRRRISRRTTGGAEWGHIVGALLKPFLSSKSHSLDKPSHTHHATKTHKPSQEFEHPDGPNIGPGSDACWFENHDQGMSAKTDLLHTGHIRGGKLLIVRTHSSINDRRHASSAVTWVTVYSVATARVPTRPTPHNHHSA